MGGSGEGDGRGEWGGGRGEGGSVVRWRLRVWRRGFRRWDGRGEGLLSAEGQREGFGEK